MSSLPTWPNAGDLALKSLDPTVRMLLTTDGTVTLMLEQLLGEPITTAGLTQSTRPAARETAEPLGVPVGTLVVMRTTALVGAETGRCYVAADAAIRLDNLPDELCTDLLTTKLPIGRLLARHRFESFRELLSWSAPGNPDGQRAATVVAERRYRIIHNRRPAFVIGEGFTAACLRQTERSRTERRATTA